MLQYYFKVGHNYFHSHTCQFIYTSSYPSIHGSPQTPLVTISETAEHYCHTLMYLLCQVFLDSKLWSFWICSCAVWNIRVCTNSLEEYSVSIFTVQYVILLLKVLHATVHAVEVKFTILQVSHLSDCSVSLQIPKSWGVGHLRKCLKKVTFMWTRVNSSCRKLNIKTDGLMKSSW